MKAFRLYPLSRRLNQLPRLVQSLLRLIILLILFFAAVQVYYAIYPVTIVIDDRYLDAAKPWHPYDESIPSPRLVEIETACSTTTQLCFTVVDLIREVVDGDNALKRGGASAMGDSFTPEHREEVRRGIYLRGFEGEYDTMVTLVAPIGMDAHNSDTRMWRINHSIIHYQYAAWVIIVPFMLGVLSANNAGGNSPKSLMMIGQGGGSIDMFIHERFPDSINITVVELDPTVRDLAQRWFGVRSDKTRQTIVKDGLVAFKESIARGEKFDVMIVDACDDDPLMPCPTKAFLTRQSLNQINTLIKPMGVVVMNILTRKGRKDVDVVRSRLLAFFPTCLGMGMEAESNFIMACLTYSISPESMEGMQRLWDEKRVTLAKQFGFEKLLAELLLLKLDVAANTT